MLANLRLWDADVYIVFTILNLFICCKTSTLNKVQRFHEVVDNQHLYFKERKLQTLAKSHSNALSHGKETANTKITFSTLFNSTNHKNHNINQSSNKNNNDPIFSLTENIKEMNKKDNSTKQINELSADISKQDNKVGFEKNILPLQSTPFAQLLYLKEGIEQETKKYRNKELIPKEPIYDTKTILPEIPVLTKENVFRKGNQSDRKKTENPELPLIHENVSERKKKENFTRKINIQFVEIEQQFDEVPIQIPVPATCDNVIWTCVDDPWHIGHKKLTLLVHPSNHTLPHNVFKNTGPDIGFVSSISLKRRSLYELPSGIFNSNIFTNLKSIDLSFNEIRSLPSDIFKQTPTISHLYLQGNQFAYFYNGMFDGLEQLQHLDASDVGLMHLSSDVFLPLVQLAVIKLSYNLLRTIPIDIFSHSPLLESIELDHNELRILELGTFTGLENLQQLSFDGNPNLLNLPRGIYFGLTRLTALGHPLNLPCYSLTAQQCAFKYSGPLQIRCSIGNVDRTGPFDRCGQSAVYDPTKNDVICQMNHPEGMCKPRTCCKDSPLHKNHDLSGGSVILIILSILIFIACIILIFHCTCTLDEYICVYGNHNYVKEDQLNSDQIEDPPPLPSFKSSPPPSPPQLPTITTY